MDRGKIALGQDLKIRVDSIPDKEFAAKLDFIAPAAALTFTGVGADMSASTVKSFPARATLTSVDERLRPGTTASADIVVYRQTNTLTIPLQASFDNKGKPVVYVQNGKGFTMRRIQIGLAERGRTGGNRRVEGGDAVALVDPVKAAKQAKKIDERQCPGAGIDSHEKGNLSFDRAGDSGWLGGGMATTITRTGR